MKINLLENMKIEDNGVGIISNLGITFQFNETGKEIINLIKKGKTKEEIVKILSEEYGKDWKDIYVDVEDFFLKLRVYGVYNEL